MQPSLTIHSSATTADLIAGTKARKRAVPRAIWQRAWVPWTLVVVLLGVLSAFSGGLVGYIMTLAPALLVAAVVVAILPTLSVRRVVRANPFLTETQSISFAEDGVECIAPSLRTKRPWEALTSWVERPAMLVLNLSDRPEGAYMVVCKGDTDDVTLEDPEAHGLPEERTAAFDLGVDDGAAACFDDPFYDSLPE